MRQGFANSGGQYIDSGCNIESNGRTQADDVLATLAFMSEQPYVDKQRIIVLGQSHGGWVTLALGASNPPVGVKGLVNFAGGLRQESCPGWKSSIARAAGGLGRDSRLPHSGFVGPRTQFLQSTRRGHLQTLRGA